MFQGAWVVHTRFDPSFVLSVAQITKRNFKKSEGVCVVSRSTLSGSLFISNLRVHSEIVAGVHAIVIKKVKAFSFTLYSINLVMFSSV